MSDKALLPGVEIDSLGLNNDGQRWESLAVDSALITGNLSDNSGTELKLADIGGVVELVQTSGSGSLFLADDGQYHEVATGGTYSDDVMLKSLYDVDRDGVVGFSALAYEIAGGATAGSDKYYGTDNFGNLGFHALSIAAGAEATSVSWANVTDKPSAFTPQVHSHDDIYYQKTEVDSKVSDKADTSHNHDSSYDVAGAAGAVQVNIDNHTAGSNPHSITAATVGLGNVDNTADADKPISSATQTALNNKANATHDHVTRVVTFLPASGDYSGEVVERNAGDSDDGYFKWSSTKSKWSKTGGLV